eukprot:Opistho-2@26219
MEFGAGPSASGASSPAGKREQIMEQVRMQMAVANAQELLQRMTEKCFTKCIYKPGTQLDGGEKTCLAKCMDRYTDAWNLVSRAYAGRLQRDRNSHMQHMNNE